jgi:predicted dinucleotide-binding enzyme
MKLGILGSGAVGRELATRLAEDGHDVVVGTRDPDATRARTAPDAMGFPPFSEWHAEHQHIHLVPFAEAAAHGGILVNATSGLGSVAALTAGGKAVQGKIVIDLANPLDFSSGFPPTLAPMAHGSLGETLQREFPEARVVKVLNTVNLAVMLRPELVGSGDHTLLMAGDDEGAKGEVRALLESFGWRDILDLGDISASRDTEAYVLLWLRMAGVVGHPKINIKVVR